MSFESEVKAVVFTNPADSGQNHITLLKELIDNTPTKQEIHICISHFNHEPVADALIAAAKRGVSIKIIMEAADTSKNSEIREYFQRNDRESKIQIIMAYGCYGTKNHIKLFLFSITTYNNKTIRYVAVAGSATITESSLNKHQNMFIVADEAFYQGLLDHWLQMLLRANLGDANSEVADIEVLSTSKRVKAYLFPRSVDPVAKIIRNVRAKVHEDSGAVPRIRIAMARWTRAKSRRKILQALIDRVQQGCIVDLVLRRDANDEDGTDDGVHPAIIGHLVFLKNYVYPSRLFIHIVRTDRANENVHSKYLLVEGYYGEGKEWENNVWSGSENWTRAALRTNDEIMVKIRDEEVYKRFLENHELLKSL